MSDTLETGDGVLKDTYPKGKKMAEQGWADSARRYVIEKLFTSKEKQKDNTTGGSEGLLEERKRRIDKAIEEPVLPKEEEEPPLRSGGPQYKNEDYGKPAPGFKKAKEKK